MDNLLEDLELRIAVLETDAVLRRIDFQLKRNVSDSFAVAKHEACTALPDYLFALQRLQKIKPTMHSWEKTASLLVSSFRAHEHADLVVQSPEFASLMHASIASVRATYNVEEAKFAKRLLEAACMSSSLVLQDEGIEFACWLVELKNPHTHLPLRALGLDVAGLYWQIIDLNKLLRLVNFALQCATVKVNHQIRDLHKGIEDSVRRLCEATNNVLIGKALVDTLWKTRGVVSAYKLSQKLHLSSHFPGLTETARKEQIAGMLALGPNKAFGWGTIKPDRRLLTISMLIQHGHHLTAKRMATELGDLDRLRIEYGCELDFEACERELAERKAKYLQLDPDVNVHMINTWEDLQQCKPVLVYGDGVLTLDVEWVPQIGHAADCPVQLMQFARGKQHVFLIDISPTSTLHQCGFHAFMHDFLSLQKEVWGFGLEMDCKMLAQSFPREQWPMLIRPRVRNIPVPNKNTGLKTMCQLVLGKELDKEQQMSLWSRRPLLPEQIAYAALDVHVLVLLHERLHDCLALQPAVIVVPTRSASIAESDDKPKVINNTGKYFCDEMLLRMAKMLRAVNVDCLFEPSSEVARRRDVIQARIQRAHKDGRTFITADTALRNLPGVYCLCEQDNEERFRELCKQFQIPLDRNTILLRCTMCNNAEFTVCTREQAREINPTVVTELVFNDMRITEYYSCASCHSVVWQGPKYKQVQSRMARLMETM